MSANNIKPINDRISKVLEGANSAILGSWVKKEFNYELDWLGTGKF